jgi:hypothetical protein
MRTGLLTVMKSIRNKIMFLSILAGMSFGSLAGKAQEKGIGDVADDFELINVMTGDPVRLSDFEGSIVLLDFFFYW